MVTIRYVFQCDVCRREIADEQACSIVWGINWQRPSLPVGWKVLMSECVVGGKLICDQHVCEIVDVGVMKSAMSG
jgi:hypothetical protein